MNIFGRFATAAKAFLGRSINYSGFWSWAFPGMWGKADLIKQYKNYVYPVVATIAENAAKVEFEVKRGETIVKKHPFIEFIKRPNPDQSQFQFLELHFTYMELCGESFWYIVRDDKGIPLEAYLIRPDLMDVVVDDESATGEVKGYVLNKPDTGVKVPFDKDEILHPKLPNPWNPYRGLGPVEAGQTYIQTEHFSADWTKNSIYNSGRPSGIVSIKGTISDEEYASVKRQFKESYQGTKNAGKTMFVRGSDGLDYTKLGMELGELALKELKDMSRDDIMLMFRANKTILGISDDVNRANALEARAVFNLNLIMPELDRFVDHLTAFLMPAWGKETLSYKDMNQRSDEQKIAEWEKGHNKWLTTNDIRKEKGLKPLPGGDVLYQPFSLAPLLAESSQPREDNPADTGVGDSGSGDTGQGDTGSADTGTNDSEDQKKKLARKEAASHFQSILWKTQDHFEGKYLDAVRKEFSLQLKEILEKNPEQKSVFPQWTFDVDASKTRLIGSLNPISLALLEEAAKLALEMAEDDETVFTLSQGMKDFIADRIDRLATATNDQTIKLIEDTIASGVANGESVNKLRDRIQEVYKEADDVRAERIARTETLAASNEGTLEAYRQSPLVTAKEWSAEPNACEFCFALNGKIVGLETDFAGNGSAVEGEDGNKLNIDYGDIEFPPLHPNCRCTILPVAQ